jgi:DNA-directed RNA polymerase specialized sigma24 family protein
MRAPALSDLHAQRLGAVRGALAEAHQAREDAITLAWLDGASLREIAGAVGMTHSGVSRLLARSGVRKESNAYE